MNKYNCKVCRDTGWTNPWKDKRRCLACNPDGFFRYCPAPPPPTAEVKPPAPPEPDLSERVKELERQVESLKVGCKAAQVMLVISTADDRFLQGAAECLREALEDAQ